MCLIALLPWSSLSSAAHSRLVQAQVSQPAPPDKTHQMRGKKADSKTRSSLEDGKYLLVVQYIRHGPWPVFDLWRTKWRQSRQQATGTTAASTFARDMKQSVRQRLPTSCDEDPPVFRIFFDPVIMPSPSDVYDLSRSRHVEGWLGMRRGRWFAGT